MRISWGCGSGYVAYGPQWVISKRVNNVVLLQLVHSIRKRFPGVWLCRPGNRRPRSPQIHSVQLGFIDWSFKVKGTPTFHGLGGTAWVVCTNVPILSPSMRARRGRHDHAFDRRNILFVPFAVHVKRPPSWRPCSITATASISFMLTTCKGSDWVLINYKHTPKSQAHVSSIQQSARTIP